MADEKILDWFKNDLGQYDGVWLSEPENLIKINDKLKEYGHRLADIHHYYIPSPYAPVMEERFPVKWYKEDEIKIFEGDDRFGEAILLTKTHLICWLSAQWKMIKFLVWQEQPKTQRKCGR